MTNLNSFLQKYGALGVLLVATLFYASIYVPAAFYAGINSDELQVLIFYHDVFVAGHAASGWTISGATLIFPEWCVCFLLNDLIGNGLEADVVLQLLLFFGWLVLFVVFYRMCGGRRIEIFLPLLILITLLATHEHLSHVGTMLNTVGCLSLMLAGWKKMSVPRLLALGVLAFLGATSDALFIVTLVAPALAALAVEGLAHPASRKLNLCLAMAILLGAGSGYLAASWVFPVPTARTLYTEPHFERVLTCLSGLWSDLSVVHHPWLTLLVAIDLLIFVLGLIAAWKFRPAMRRGTPLMVFLLAYTFFLVVLNWGALFITNEWSSRYVYFPLIWPPILLAIFVSRFCPVRFWPGGGLALGVAGYAVFLAFHPLPKSPEYLAALQRAADLRALTAREHLEAGFAQYWIAGITTYLSGNTVCVRPMAGTNFYHWYSNLQWVEGDAPGRPLPRFRYIITPELDPVELRARFGPPDEVTETSLHEPVWIYSEANAIIYNPVFGDLGNRYTYPAPNEAAFTAAALPAESGHLQGTARIARAGQDSVGCVTFGPYLHSQPGRYRADYAYTYLKAPDADKPVMFDCVLHTDHEVYLSQAPVRYVDAKPEVFSQTFAVPNHPPGATLEYRLHYYGSGDIEVDSLHITYLGPK